MSLNTYPNNPFPPSTEQMHRGDNEELQAQIDAIKDSATIDSFGDVETALEDKTDTAVIAPAFDAESGVYAVGDLVMYQGKLYEFTTAHETAGDWDSTEVTEKTVSNEIDTVKSGLTNYEKQNNINLEVPNRKNLIDSSAFSNGYFTSDGAFTENQYYYATDYIKVEPNTDYVVSGFTGGGAYFVYYNASKTVLSTIVDTTTFKTPANTAFVRLSIKRDGMTNPQMELGTTATAYTPYIPSVESRIEAVESGLIGLGTLHDMVNKAQQDDFVGKYAIIGKICFFSLICTKSQASYTLGMIEGVLPISNWVLVAYDSTNNHGVYAATAGGNTGTFLQMSTGVLADKVAVSGCFLIQ